jgi:3-methyladenine DNA glycosylase Mpg
MKNTLLVISIGFLTGCSTLQGYVNQERIEYVNPLESGKKSELYTYVVKVDELLKVYGKENNTKTDVTLDAKKVEASLNVSHEDAQKIIKIANDLDQVNSQNYPILFTIFMGLNANPSSKENRDEFWKALNKVTDNTLESRRLGLK